MAIIMITHDLGVIAEHVRRGHRHVRRHASASSGTADEIFYNPAPRVHQGPAALHAHGWTTTRRQADAHRRHAAVDLLIPAQGLRLRRPLRPLHEDLPDEHAAE